MALKSTLICPFAFPVFRFHLFLNFPAWRYRRHYFRLSIPFVNRPLGSS
jgi:hypothetical protein